MRKSQSGQTIIEAIVALVTILLIITAIAIVIVSGLYNSSFIKNQNEANKYAQQGIELVRNIQKNDLKTFRGYVDDSDPEEDYPYYCIDEQTSTLYGDTCSNTGINTATSFNRVVEFSPGGGDCQAAFTDSTTAAARVTVTVKWSSSKCPASNTFCHESKLVTCMPYVYPASNP